MGPTPDPTALHDDSDRLRDWPIQRGFESLEIRAADRTRLRIVVGGSGGPAAPRIVMLHGAPQHAFAWRHVMDALSGEALVVAPDLRGYGQSDLSQSASYDIDTLAGDVASVLEGTRSQAGGPTILVAHDWGAPIAYHYATLHGSALHHLIVANGPHLGAYARQLASPAQMLRSWYTALFQLPRLEILLHKTRARFFTWMLRQSSPRGLFSEDELEMYREALERPGRCRAVLEYYREAASSLRTDHDAILNAPVIQTPTTIVWGDLDRALARTQPEATQRYLRTAEIRHLAEASHWVPEERPDALVRAIRDALSRQRAE